MTRGRWSAMGGGNEVKYAGAAMTGDSIVVDVSTPSRPEVVADDDHHVGVVTILLTE